MAKACGCLNHKGHQKQMHKSRDAAIHQLMQARYGDGLAYTIYECPKVPGVFHVHTARPAT